MCIYKKKERANKTWIYEVTQPDASSSSSSLPPSSSSLFVSVSLSVEDTSEPPPSLASPPSLDSPSPLPPPSATLAARRARLLCKEIINGNKNIGRIMNLMSLTN